ncbi:MAG: hypothetical protein ACP5VR_06585 [Acidimicrobiales bacterium]
MTVDPLDADNARAIGQLCGATGTADIVGTSVVLLARALGGTTVTCKQDDLRRLGPTANIVAL